MRLPDLVKTLELSDLPKIHRVKEVISRWAILKSLTYNKLIIKPLVRSFNETPYVVVNDDLTINEVGLWVLNDGKSSKVLVGRDDELVVNGRCYTFTNDSILCIDNTNISVVDTVGGSEEVLISGYDDVDVKPLYGSSIAIVGRDGRKYVVIPTLKEKVMEVQDLHYVDSKTTAILLIKYKRKYFLLIHHKYLGISKFYELGRCDDFKEVLVGDGLGILRCGKTTYLISYDELLKIPQLNLEPIASVGSDYILYEPSYGVLVRFDGREFKQLLFLEKPNIVGKISTNDLIVISKGYPYIITDNVCKVITNQKVVYGSTGNDYIILRTFKELEVYSKLTHIASYKPLECRLINNNLICLRNSKVYIYDLDNLYEARVDLNNEYIDKYPSLIITPWYSESKLVVRGPIVIEEVKTSSNSKEFNVKPFKLGKELTFKVIYDAVLTQFNNEFKVRLNNVELRDLRINSIKYSPNGSLNNSGDNLLVDLILSTYNPTPEEIPLLIKYVTTREDNSSDCKTYTYVLKPGSNELRISNTLRTSEKILQILIEFKWFNRNEGLAKLVFDLSKYIVREPVKEINFTIRELSDCLSKLIVTPSYDDGLEVPINVVVTCSDNNVFRGVNELFINKCLLPAVIEFNYSYEGFTWRKYKVVKNSDPVVLDVRPSTVYDVSISSSSRCVDGFLMNESLLNVNIEELVRELSVEPYIDRTPKIKVSYKLSTEGMVLAVLGSSVSYCRGREGLLTIDFNDITKDLIVVVLGSGIRRIFTVDHKVLFRKFLELGAIIGTLLKPKLLGGGLSEVYKVYEELIRYFEFR
jgi:hypothetical protein